ncbi:S8 family peptidase [Evansella sp. AB-rgal1]|uniref:S8 family peptidase n=1 Tax=Evansella sp. AB-rgal1 TaxID=3242696 RepID=UPI00359E9161
MNALRRLTIGFSIVLLTVLGLWFVSDHTEEEDQVTEYSTLRAAMDDIMAEDLKVTIQMFLYQIEEDIRGWDKESWSDETVRTRMLKEVEDHPHILGFYYKHDGMEYTVGNVTEDYEQRFVHRKDNGIALSDPFIDHGKKHILMGKIDIEETYVAEVDLSFIENFVKDTAAVADSNGQFFIGDGKIDVSLEKEEAELPYARKEIPEIGWNLYVQSEESDESEEHYKQGEVIIELEPNINDKQWAEEQNVTVIDRINSKIVVRSPNSSTEQLMEKWVHDNSVVYMEPNFMYSKQTIDYRKRPRRSLNYFGPMDNLQQPNDEFYEPYQWNLSQIFADEAWNVTIGKTGVPIAIVDSGIDGEHLDLAEKITDGFNAFENNGAYHDEHGHGTHVAGIAAAITNNLDGIAGVSWNNPILAVKSLDHNAEGNSLSIAKGIIWAVDNGAKVINLSLGDAHDSDIMYEAIRYAYENDVVLIAASGNDNVEIPMYPAAYKEVLAVGAVDPHRERAFFSNYGNHIDVTAPGEHIPSTFLSNQYVMMSGTSMAAPHVAGMAGLIRSVNPELTNEEIYTIIRNTSDDLGEQGYDPFYGYGEINMKQALEEIRH